MADPSGGISPELWTLIFGGIGSAVAAFAIRMGWKKGNTEMENPTQVAEIKSAIVDSSSIKVLAGSIEGLGFTLMELKKGAGALEEKNTKLVERLIECVNNLTDELREHSREIRDHAREVAKSK